MHIDLSNSKAKISKPDAIIVSVGGGGLACGILEGMHRNGWHDVPVITTETIGADCFYQALKANKIIILKAISSKATSLGAKTVCQRLYDWSKQHPIYPIHVTDEVATDACYDFASDKGILTELAAGAALSVPYTNPSIIEPYENILVIVCGGVNTEFLLKDKTKLTI